MLSGSVTAAWELFSETTEAEMRSRAFEIPGRRARLAQAMWGDEADLLGAASLVRSTSGSMRPCDSWVPLGNGGLAGDGIGHGTPLHQVSSGPEPGHVDGASGQNAAIFACIRPNFGAKERQPATTYTLSIHRAHT